MKPQNRTNKYTVYTSLLFCILIKFNFGQIRSTPTMVVKYKCEPFEIINCKPLQVEFDTLNICRIRNNGIKRIKVYEFENSELLGKTFNDSTLYVDIIYDSLGFIVFNKPKYVCLDNQYLQLPMFSCEGRSSKKNDLTLKNKTIIEKNRYYKITSIYDSLGYLIEYKKIKRGLIKYHNTIGGFTNAKIKIMYSNNYKNIQVENYRSHWNRFPIESKEQINEYKFDDFQNLLSDRSFDCYSKRWFIKHNYYYN